MRGIAVALRNQKLRQMYPAGVLISNVIQGYEGDYLYYVEMTSLKNGHTIKPIGWRGVLGIVPATHDRDALIETLKKAGVQVEEA
ncbi:MAG: hypothetical protein OXH00_26180 [Candidatus Poribacteria bacterium]|nr:hypothetical protein [Candidatus Poribacteria bacterium]